MALKDKLMTLEDFKAVRDVDVASNSAQFTEIKADLEAQNDLVVGEKTEETPTAVSGINFAEGATKYTSNGNYTTLYIPVSQFDDYVISVDNTENGNAFEARFAFSTEIPANNVEGTYADKVNVNARKSGTYEYHADVDGYLGIAYWTNNAVTFTVESLTGGIKQRISAVEDMSAEVETVNGRIDAVEAGISGTKTEETLIAVSGLNFVTNATKYNSSGNYTTYYIPVVAGAKYTFNVDNHTNPNVVILRFVFSSDVPSANVAGTFIEEFIVAKYGNDSYEYTPLSDGYIGFAYYTNNISVFSAESRSGGIENRVTVIEQLGQEIRQTSEIVNGFIAKETGKTITFETGTFWYGTPTIGTTLESNIQRSTSGGKRAVVELPAGKTLRVVGLGATTSTRLYFVFDATSGVLIDVSDTTEQLKLQAHYLRYDIDTHVYINNSNSNAGDYFCQIVDDISSWIDLSKSLGVSQDNVLNLNDNVRYVVRSLRRSEKSKPVPVTFLHFSDIHGDVLELKRIMDFAQDGNISPYIHDIICTGDITYLSLDDEGVDFLDDVSGAENVLLLVGNHDTAEGVGSSGTTYGTATPERVYNELFKDRIANWNVTQPENADTEYLSYYYKDYATQKLRLICLDANHGADYISAQTTWFESVLLSAYNAGYSVICASHYMFARSDCSVVDCSFSPRKEMSNEGSWTIPTAFINAVEAFIGYGGEFVCWFGGHVHQDHVILHNNNHQLCIGVSTASHDSKQTGYGDDLRLLGTRSQDLFNIMAIDTYSKHISILRVGANLTRLMHSKNHLCINYATRQVIWND